MLDNDTALCIPNPSDDQEAQVRKLSEGIVYKAMDVSNAEEARAFLTGLDRTRALFRSAKEFKKYRKKFQILEIESLVLLYEKHDPDGLIYEELRGSLTKQEFSALEWLCGLSKDERNTIIHDTSCLYTTAYKRAIQKDELETGVHEQSKTALEVSTSWANKRVMEYVDNSQTNICVDSLKEDLFNNGITDYPGTLVSDTQDGVKKRLLLAGAVGVGDGEYVSRYNEEKVGKAIGKRVYSLQNDVKKLIGLIQDANRETEYCTPISFGTRGDSIVRGEDANIALAVLTAFAVNSYSVDSREYTSLDVTEKGTKIIVYSLLNSLAHCIDCVPVAYQSGSLEHNSTVYNTVINWFYDHSDENEKKATEAMRKLETVFVGSADNGSANDDE